MIKTKRIIFTYICICLCFLLSAVRFAYIINDKTYSAAAIGSNRSIKISNIRGTIFDSSGIRLTNSEYEYIAAVPPKTKAINAVSKYLTLDQRATLSQGYPVTVKVDKNFVSNEVTVIKIPKRYNNIAAHIIGYCDNKNNGICGIEQSYNKLLKGEQIKISYNVDAFGRAIGNTEQVIGDTNYNSDGIMLTIDSSLQKLCENTAKKYMSQGAIVVLENNTGKIRSMVSTPSYDSNNIATSLDSDSSPFFNRCLAAYNCGSVFKLLVAACALHNNIDLKYSCKGFIDIGDTRFNCLSKHKKTNMSKALELSCNCYFIKLGQKIGAKKLLDFAKTFGFGNEIKLCTSIISSGAKMPEFEDLQEKPAELANFSFGQGVILTSPLQIASMVQCIANGGKLIKPTLIEGRTDYRGVLKQKQKETLPTYILEKKDADKLCSYMINVVNSGTGKTAKPLKNGAGGKTATAQTGIFDKNGKPVYQTWFGGFYPAKNPKYTIVVLCENGNSGSKTAAPVFKKIADAIYNLEQKH